MKHLLKTFCMAIFLFSAFQVSAQEVKVKEDKSKMRDKSRNVKVKDKDDKFKLKEGDSKMKTTEDGTKMKGDTMAMTDMSMKNSSTTAYTPRYSNFAIGNPEYVTKVLTLFKDWDDNQLTRNDFFADTIMMVHEDGTMSKGKADVMKGGQAYRGGMTSAKSTIIAIVPLKAVDSNEDWVAVWAHEDDVMADGKKQGREIHEIWRFNKDGKVDYVQSYSGGSGMQPGQ
jgi:hypothetical protein